jgi:hypothetical protein
MKCFNEKLNSNFYWRFQISITLEREIDDYIIKVVVIVLSIDDVPKDKNLSFYLINKRRKNC